MARIRTFVKRRLSRLRNRQLKLKTLKTTIKVSNYQHIPRYDVCFRIGGAGNLHREITERIGITPSIVHLAGERRGLSDRVWDEDIWVLNSPLDELASIDAHIESLAAYLRTHMEFFSQVVRQAKWADICIGCISETSFPLLCIAPRSLTLFKELDVGLSFNFTCV